MKKEFGRHLLLLDALRGVAALIVVWYHCFEGVATSVVSQGCNHGYLAVDFFFILSGFVIGYAYDGRFREGRMTAWNFAKRRLVRLHPMVVFGVVFGVLTFILGGRQNWSAETVPLKFVMFAMLLNLFLIPVAPGWKADVRGNGEMFPLNGPNWSLFFEYIGNIIYVLLLRKLPTRILSCLTAASGSVLAWIVIGNGYLGVGWTLPDFWSGLVRMLFPYCAGMLLARAFVRRRGKAALLPRFIRRHAFLVCSVILLVLLPMPFVGSESSMWVNGLYIILLVFAVFPFIIWTAAEGSEETLILKQPGKIYRFIGELSYPLYAVHYPLMYLFYAAIGFPNVKVGMGEVWPLALAAAAASVVVAVLAMELYDKPIRRFLAKKVL